MEERGEEGSCGLESMSSNASQIHQQHQRRRTADVSSSVSSFDDLALPSWLVSGLEDCGFIEPSPVQALAIPLALSGADLLVRARSGTGKTAAFGVPAVLIAAAAAAAASSSSSSPSSSPSSVSAPRVLILAPTREVALQAAEVVSALLSRVPLSSSPSGGGPPRPSVAAFVGGLPPSADVARCRRPLTVVAATPGRARALAAAPSPSSSSSSSSPPPSSAPPAAASVAALDLSEVSLLVLDEADALLSAPLAGDVRFLASACGCPGGQRRKGRATRPRPPPQVLAFSATLDEASAKAASRLMSSGNPRRVDASPRGPALEGVTHYYLPILESRRRRRRRRNKGQEENEESGGGGGENGGETSPSSPAPAPPPPPPPPPRLYPTQSERDAAVVTALSSAPFCQAAVFVSSRAHAASLTSALRKAGYPAVELSGALPQPERMEAVDALRSFQARIAVATDLGARGVDLERVNLVVNADGLPQEWRRNRGSASASGSKGKSNDLDDAADDNAEKVVSPSPSPSSSLPPSPLPEGAATLAHRAGRAGRFGGRGACITLVSADDDDDADADADADDDDDDGGGEGGEEGEEEESEGDEPSELSRLRQALASLGAPSSAPERLPSALPASAYRYSPPTPEERRRHAEMVSLREEAERRRRGEEEEDEEEEERGEEKAQRRLAAAPKEQEEKRSSSVLRYSSKELRAMRGAVGEEEGTPAPLPAALAKASAAAAARPRPAVASAPKTPPAAATAKGCPPLLPPPPAPPPPPPPPPRLSQGDDEFDLDDDALEAAIRAVHAAAAAEEEEEEESEEEEEEGEEEEADEEESERETTTTAAAAAAAAAAPPPFPAPLPPPPLSYSSLLPCPFPCPTCSVMVPPGCSNEASKKTSRQTSEPLVAVPASLLRRYYELEWESWARRNEQWQQAALWRAWWSASGQQQQQR